MVWPRTRSWHWRRRCTERDTPVESGERRKGGCGNECDARAGVSTGGPARCGPAAAGRGAVGCGPRPAPGGPGADEGGRRGRGGAAAGHLRKRDPAPCLVLSARSGRRGGDLAGHGAPLSGREAATRKPGAREGLASARGGEPQQEPHRLQPPPGGGRAERDPLRRAAGGPFLRLGRGEIPAHGPAGGHSPLLRGGLFHGGDRKDSRAEREQRPLRPAARTREAAGDLEGGV